MSFPMKFIIISNHVQQFWDVDVLDVEGDTDTHTKKKKHVLEDDIKNPKSNYETSLRNSLEDMSALTP